MIALPGTADLTNPKAVRAAMGALFRLPHLHADDDAAFAWLATKRVSVWATEMQGEPIATVPMDGAIAIVLGNEGAGVRADILRRAERAVCIPIDNGVESLNVAVAAGILLHHLGVR